jgi:hypothetical protein
MLDEKSSMSPCCFLIIVDANYHPAQRFPSRQVDGNNDSTSVWRLLPAINSCANRIATDQRALQMPLRPIKRQRKIKGLMGTE